jgi:hypothetical protein
VSMSCSECAKAEVKLAGLVVIFGVFYRVLTPEQVAEVRRQLQEHDLALPA